MHGPLNAKFQIYVIDISGAYSNVHVSIILCNAMSFRRMKMYDLYFMLSKD